MPNVPPNGLLGITVAKVHDLMYLWDMKVPQLIVIAVLVAACRQVQPLTLYYDRPAAFFEEVEGIWNEYNVYLGKSGE